MKDTEKERREGVGEWGRKGVREYISSPLLPDPLSPPLPYSISVEVAII